MSDDSMTVKQLSDLCIKHGLKLIGMLSHDGVILGIPCKDSRGFLGHQWKNFPDLASLGRYVKATYVLTVPTNKKGKQVTGSVEQTNATEKVGIFSHTSSEGDNK